MKPTEMQKPESKSKLKIYKLPGDNTYQYVVENGQWKTRKTGSKKFIAIASLPDDKRIEATLRLDDEFKNARTSKEKQADRDFMGDKLMDMSSDKAAAILKKVGRA